MQSKKSFHWKQALSTALFVALLAMLCWYLYKNRADMQKLLTLDGGTIAKLLALALAGCVMNCVYHRIILGTYGIPLQLTDWLGVVFVSNAIAYVLPMRADLVFSAAYYKHVKGLAYVKSASMAAGNILFGVVFALLQILAALLCTGLIEGVWSLTLWALWGVLTLCVALFIVFSLLAQAREFVLLQKSKLLRDLVEGFNALLRNRRLLWRLLACSIVSNLVQLLLYMVCFAAVGMRVTVYQALFYNSVSWLSSIVAIVPGNIGIKEGMMGVATSLMGTLVSNDAAVGVAVSLLQRVSVMVVYLAGGLAFGLPVWRKWSRGKARANATERP
ncbi:MAG: lysylphosphatidylglycerol synthase domain-containing protein [Clostridia bacterium]